MGIETIAGSVLVKALQKAWKAGQGSPLSAQPALEPAAPGRACAGLSWRYVTIEDSVITVQPSDICDGATLAPDKVGRWLLIEAALAHDALYAELDAIAEAWGWPLSRVRRWADDVFYGLANRPRPSPLAGARPLLARHQGWGRHCACCGAAAGLAGARCGGGGLRWMQHSGRPIWRAGRRQTGLREDRPMTDATPKLIARALSLDPLPRTPKTDARRCLTRRRAANGTAGPRRRNGGRRSWHCRSTRCVRLYAPRTPFRMRSPMRTAHLATSRNCRPGLNGGRFSLALGHESLGRGLFASVAVFSPARTPKG